MAFFWHTVSCNANTSKQNPERKELKLQHGIVHRVVVIIPSGHAGLMHVQIYDALHEVYPTTPNETFHGDDIVISFRDWFDLKRAPFALNAVFWNTDDTYNHEMVIGFGVLPKWVLLPQLFGHLLKRGWDKLAGFEEEV